MASHYTAIIHLREAATAAERSTLEPTLRFIRGVEAVDVEPAEPVVAVRFDGAQTGLAELVRAVEASGAAVAGVAQRLAAD